VIARCAAKVGDAPTESWDAAMLRLRAAFAAELWREGASVGQVDGRPSAAVEALVRDSEELVRHAPDLGRRGHVNFYRAVISDKVLGRRHRAPAFLAAALNDATAGNDPYVAYEALRHLGDHSMDEGDLTTAMHQWVASGQNAVRAGSVRSALAQVMLLARLAMSRGDSQAAAALAGVVLWWADALGANALRDEASAFKDSITER
jgi:hypothetical protein